MSSNPCTDSPWFEGVLNPKTAYTSVSAERKPAGNVAITDGDKLVFEGGTITPRRYTRSPFLKNPPVRYPLL